ncbi:M1 family metallopeptidase [Flavitalea flava]
MKHRIRRILFFCSWMVVGAAWQLPVNAQTGDYWQQQVDYTITVSLNDKEHTLDGFLRIQYTNYSPDTLSFIWIHLWPNAFKNERTAFGEQLLGNGRTDFYFSDKQKKGYINHLDFRVDEMPAKMEDHPGYIDIVKINLPHLLLPGGQITITTPFHEQLPYNFSRGGHVGRTYQVTQWYPKPAVYDKKGWHPIPYLDQGEFYGEFGNFDVRITVPKDYIVAATGELQNGTGRQETGDPSAPPNIPVNPSPKGSGKGSAKNSVKGPGDRSTKAPRKPSRYSSGQHSAKSTPENLSDSPVKTLQYKQTNVHDFAWFADKHFRVGHDTLQLASGRVIDIYAFYTSGPGSPWKNSTQYIKDAVRFRSSLVGEYPFNVVSAAEVNMAAPGGMEYPTLTGITSQRSEKGLDLILEHEVGHNWFYGILGTNERRYPWMDEGINTYYDNRYELQKYKQPGPTPANAGNNWLLRKIPADQDRLFIDILAKEKRDQPISTPSEDFTDFNYDLIAYAKTGLWMKQLEDSLGTGLFDSCMQDYYRRWQFKHPYPEDFQRSLEKTGGRSLEGQFALLDKKGPLSPFNNHRKIKPAILFSARNTDKFNYINILPAAGYNKYDQFMIGGIIHNYDLPPNALQFVLAPLYATNSHQLNGMGDLSYTWHPEERFQKIRLGIGAARFSTRSETDSNGKKLFAGFYKFAPSLRFTLKNKSARSTQEKWIEWKTFLIGENAFNNYVLKTSDSIRYPTAAGKYNFRYLNQLSIQVADDRVLYPYKALLQVQQASQFYRINFTGNYFFNYAEGGGMDLRFFAAKFGYIGNNGSAYNLNAFLPKLTAVGGSDDYTYSNYFVGRNEQTGFASQQIMNRDGDLKIRVNLFPFVEGRSENWVSALNLASTLPSNIVPGWIPIKVFLDLGSYSEAWKSNAPTSRFLYVAGLELSLLHNSVHVYAPIVYSSDFGDQLKTLSDQNTFWKKISFSIDIQNFNYRKVFGNIPF